MFHYVQFCQYDAPTALESLRADMFAAHDAATWVDIGLHCWRCDPTDTCSYPLVESLRQGRGKRIANAICAAHRNTGEFDNAGEEAEFLAYYRGFLQPIAY